MTARSPSVTTMHKYAAWLDFPPGPVAWTATQPAMRRTLDNRALTRLPYWNCPSGSVRLRRAERHLLSRWLSSGEFAASLRAPELCAWSGQVWERSAGPPSSSGGLIMHAENRALEGCWHSPVAAAGTKSGITQLP